ncbi:AraC family transcriptional regulator [Lascolabacillus massiliensis]|uniref:AraC family transcriptional regulator n=1 Tax=Lascolabacillus massiliensis TaxID=1627894 RepID=UPI0006B36C22|nr:helix-turn-helix domain-containing protein [Lascolabacillus massiliensis]
MSSHVNNIINEITPLSDKDCFYIADRRKSEFTYPLHSHSEYELNYVENAAGVKRIVGDSVEVIGNWDLTLITGDDLEHVWEQHECTSRNIREITIQFSKDLFFDNFIHKNQFSSIKNMLIKAQKGINFPMETIMRVYPMLDKLSSEESGFHAVMNLMHILYELSLCENCHTLASSSFAQAEDNTDSRRVKKIYDYINAHYKEDIRLEELANLVGMTPVAFSRFFKLRAGKTISEYIIDIRLGNATRLLVDTTNTISEICYECGFNNVSNFNRIFKKRKECSPKVFRENYRKTKLIV